MDDLRRQAKQSLSGTKMKTIKFSQACESYSKTLVVFIFKGMDDGLAVKWLSQQRATTA